VAPPLTDDLPDGAAVGIDTNVFIYFIEANPKYLNIVEPLFGRVVAGSVVARVSAVTLTEVLIKPLRQGKTDVADEYRRYLTQGTNVVLHDVSQALAEQGAALAAAYGLRTPDAIVCATALGAACAYLITNDGKFDRVPGIRTLKVESYAQ
jgi:predicted nucleic acid-binding protein